MGLFEFFGERFSPGPIGGVDVGRPETEPQPLWIVVLRVTISIAGLVGLLVLLGFPFGIGGVAGCLLYVFLGTVVHPEPDYSNVGFLGGMIDHPFRYSDDLNRILIFLLIALWPGRVIGTGFLSATRLLRDATRSKA